MSKLIYFNDGIYGYCKDYLINCENKLQNAISKSSFDVPNDFCYKSYINELDSLLISYREKIKYLNKKIFDIDENYNALSLSLVSNVNKMTISKIKDRDRMIV